MDVVLLLAVEEATLVRRLLDRAAKEHRADAKPASIAERLAGYRQFTEPEIDHYRGERVPVLAVDGSRPVPLCTHASCER